ncbi:hypothetical protein B296_00034592 [Ensete ventricosum]|uniref:Uncharacterized protein n=1 Tax=Ensete ventricosum TaxID=4639 RepID=A0A426YMI0_ENSVE|nr:hypothetical protein B296_00034592 [Ensete ventricosum]
MVEGQVEPSIDASSSPPSVDVPAPAATSGRSPQLLLRPRREPFEHGLLPIPKLIFSDGTQTLAALAAKLLHRSITSPHRVDAPALADGLQISLDHARLALETLASVIPFEPDPDGAANVHDIVLFLYIQSYKRLVPRPHKDSASIADVWPSTSAFDGYLSALSPLQVPELLYAVIVLTMERFEHLGFLLHFSEGIPLTQAAPFFANSDPAMPAVPVSAAQVHDWLVQNIIVSLEHNAEKVLAKDNNMQNAADLDVPMTDSCSSHPRVQSSSPPGTSVPANSTYLTCVTFVEGISKASVVKQPCDIKGPSLKVRAHWQTFICTFKPGLTISIHSGFWHAGV